MESRNQWDSPLRRLMHTYPVTPSLVINITSQCPSHTITRCPKPRQRGLRSRLVGKPSCIFAVFHDIPLICITAINPPPLWARISYIVGFKPPNIYRKLPTPISPWSYHFWWRGPTTSGDLIEDKVSATDKSHPGLDQWEQEHGSVEKGAASNTGTDFCTWPVHGRRLDNDGRKVGGRGGVHVGAARGVGNGSLNLGVANETNLDSLASTSSES